MNKRQQKKQLNSLLATLGEGEALVIGNNNPIRHFFPIFSIVKAYPIEGSDTVPCYHEETCLSQGVSIKDLIIK